MSFILALLRFLLPFLIIFFVIKFLKKKLLQLMGQSGSLASRSNDEVIEICPKCGHEKRFNHRCS